MSFSAPSPLKRSRYFENGSPTRCYYCGKRLHRLSRFLSSVPIPATIRLTDIGERWNPEGRSTMRAHQKVYCHTSRRAGAAHS
jgi:hypothetical protein